MAGKVQVVVGGQFGSEGKGAIASYLGLGNRELMAVRVAGPNAGHSALDPQGLKWALRQIPVVAVSNPDARLVIGAGSEIDQEVLDYEVAKLETGGIKVSNRLTVDGEATLISEADKMAEDGLVKKIGSTGKGIGSARARRILRQGGTFGQGQPTLEPEYVVRDTTRMLAGHLRDGGDVMIEGTQGFGLGLHAGYYPFCTSSDCRAVDFLAMAGISPWADYVHGLEVWVVLRTYPIRVAGNSGPLMGETSWEALKGMSGGHIKSEKTTVTQKIRRVGLWDSNLAQRAIEGNGGKHVRVALTFYDYWHPTLYEESRRAVLGFGHREELAILSRNIGAPIRLVGTGPGSVIDLRS